MGSVKKNNNLDEQPKQYRGVSALWDNRISNHSVVHSEESIIGRHGTRVTSLADTGYYDPNSKSQKNLWICLWIKLCYATSCLSQIENTA